MTKDIEIIWVDFGGVLSPPYTELFAHFEQRTGITRAQMESISYQYGQKRGMAPLAPLELALVTQEEWGSEVERMLLDKWPNSNVEAADFRNFGRVWFEGAKANQRLEEALISLKNHYPVELGIVTNNVREWEPYWKSILGERLPWKYIVDSSKIGWRKPDPEFFALAQEIAGVSAEECLLIDDFHGNITQARNLDWRTIHYRNNSQAITELRQFFPHN